MMNSSNRHLPAVEEDDGGGGAERESNVDLSRAPAPSNRTSLVARFLPRLPSSPFKSSATAEDIAEFDRAKAAALAAKQASNNNPVHESSANPVFSFFGNNEPPPASNSMTSPSNKKKGFRVPSAKFDPVPQKDHDAFLLQQERAKRERARNLPPVSSASTGAKKGFRVPSAQYTPVSEEDHAEFLRLQEEEAKRRHRFLPRLPSQPRLGDPDQAAINEFDKLKAGANGGGGAQKLGSTLSMSQLFSNNAALLNGAGNFTKSMAHIHTKEEEMEIKMIEASTPQAPVIQFKTYRERLVYEIRFRHACERAIMACFAVCLLWLTSLTVAQSIVNNLIVGPPLALVMNKIDNATEATLFQRESYGVCANRTVLDCNRLFDYDLHLETQKCGAILNQTREELDYYEEQRGECAESFGRVVLIIDYLTNVMDRQFDGNFTLGNFSRPQCASVAKTLADQMAAIRAHETAEKFQADTEEMVAGFHEQYRARMAYDLAFSANATVGFALSGEELNQLVADPRTYFDNMASPKDRMYACIYKNGTYGSETCPNTPLLAKIENQRLIFQQSFESSTQTARNYFATVENQFRPMQTFYNKFSEVVKTVDGIRAQLDGAAADNNGGSLATMGYSDNAPGLDAFPAFLSSAQFSATIGSTQAYEALMGRAQGKQLSADAGTAGEMKEDEAAIKEAQRAWQAGFFSDYNPPSFDVDAAAVDWQETSSAYLPELSANLKVVATRVSAPQDNGVYEASLDTTSSGNAAKSLIPTPDVMPLNLFAYDNINLQNMMGDWMYITSLAQYMDYTYRILHSISIIRSYWRLSSVLCPPADVRVGSVPRGQTGRTRQTADQMLAKILTHPAVLLSVALIFIGLICASFLALYLPIFDEYVSGCVTGNYDEMGYTRNGTMITRNVFTVAVEYASGPGDAIVSSGIDQINIQRELMCSKNEDWTFQQQRVNRQEYNFHVRKMNELVQTVQTFRECVNMTAVDLVVQEAGALAATNSSLLGEPSLFDQACDTQFAPLNEYEFQCNNIRSCADLCNGTNTLAYQSIIYTAGCNLEYYVHSGVLGTGFAALAFLLMNLSRCTVLRGLRRVFMQYFAQGEYSYLGTTSEFGEIEYPDAVAVDGQSFKEYVMIELHETIKRFERVGWIIVLIGLLLNVPWIVGLFSFANNLRFSEITGGGAGMATSG